MISSARCCGVGSTCHVGAARSSPRGYVSAQKNTMAMRYTKSPRPLLEQRLYASSMGQEDGPTTQTNMKKKKKTFSSFEEMVQQREVVLVDFYAQWCGPCQMMAKVMSECSQDMKDVAFVKINTEKYQEIASKFQVSALPTLVLFKNGKPIRRLEGALSASQLRLWITESLRSL